MCACVACSLVGFVSVVSNTQQQLYRYLLTTFVPILILIACAQDWFKFDSDNTKWFCVALQIPFPIANLGIGIGLLTSKHIRRWISRLTIEKRFFSRPSSVALSLLIFVLPFIPVVQIITSAIMFMYVCLCFVVCAYLSNL